MGIPHKAFDCKRIIICASFFIYLLSCVSYAQANSSIFEVKGVKVDVTADNSVQAKDQAFYKAQWRAFNVLAKRMVEDEQFEAFEMPDADAISTFVKDYEVTNERISGVRYVGTYTFRFRERAVSQYFASTGVSYTETSSTVLLVLPILQRDGKNSIWAHDNIWLQAWSRAQLPDSLVPVEVPLGDLADIADIDDNDALRYERAKLDNMLSRYGAKEAAIMIAVPDMGLSQMYGDDKAVGRMRVSIYRTDRARAEYVKDLIVESDGQETVYDLYDRAVKRGHAALQRNWKHRTVTSSTQNQTYFVRVPLSDIRQWVNVQNTLKTLAGVSDVSVLSMKKNEARLYFTYRGNEVRLRDALEKSSLSLSQPYENRYVHGYAELGRNAPDMMYDLSVMQKKTRNFYQGIEPAAGEPQSEQQSGVHTF